MRRAVIVYKAAVFVLAVLLIIAVIRISNGGAAAEREEEPIVSEPPVPESRTRIEYRTIEVPYEVTPEPVFVDRYIERVVYNPNRYSGMPISDEDRELLACIVYHEARGESLTGQRMVVEVILNRVLSEKFPDTIREVVYQKNQFVSAAYVSTARPNETQYQAVGLAITETPFSDEDVLYFSQGAYNDRVFCRLGSHVFCRG